MELNCLLGFHYGGPLFFAHYSFMGLDPHGLKDEYADYWEQNYNHTLINYKHCVINPNHFKGYGENCWGLTASDTYDGYNAHSPANDFGTIITYRRALFISLHTGIFDEGAETFLLRSGR